MYVCPYDCSELATVRPRFAVVELVTTLTRTRRGVPIDQWLIYRLSRPIGSPLDPPHPG